MLSPELPEMLDELESRIDEVRRINAIDSPEPLYRSVGRGLYLLGESFHQAAIAIFVDGVRKGEISKRAAADQLQMHPNTLDRWIQRFEEQYTTATGNSAMNKDVIQGVGKKIS